MIGDDQEFPISQDIFEFESPSIQCKFQNLLSTNLPIGCQGNQSVAPYVPVDEFICEKAFEFGNLNSKDILLDLGCGDGIILRKALELLPKVACIGVELDPVLYEHCYKTVPGALFFNCDMFAFNLDERNVTICILYLLPDALKKLKSLLSNWITGNPTIRRVVTIGYSISDWAPQETSHVKKDASGKAFMMGGSTSETQPLFLYNIHSFAEE